MSARPDLIQALLPWIRPVKLPPPPLLEPMPAVLFLSGDRDCGFYTEVDCDICCEAPLPPLIIWVEKLPVAACCEAP